MCDTRIFASHVLMAGAHHHPSCLQPQRCEKSAPECHQGLMWNRWWVMFEYDTRNTTAAYKLRSGMSSVSVIFRLAFRTRCSSSLVLKMHFACCRGFKSRRICLRRFWELARNASGLPMTDSKWGWVDVICNARKKYSQKALESTNLREFYLNISPLRFAHVWEGKECENHYKYHSLSSCRIIKEIRVCYKLFVASEGNNFYNSNFE